MKRFLFSLLLAAGCVTAHAQTSGCPNPQNFSSSAAIVSSGATQLIAAPGADPNYPGHTRAIHLCAVTLEVVQGTSAANFGLIAGTDSSCGTSTAVVNFFLGVASSSQSWGQTFGSNPLPLPPGTGLCLNLSAAPTGATVHVLYSIW